MGFLCILLFLHCQYSSLNSSATTTGIASNAMAQPTAQRQVVLPPATQKPVIPPPASKAPPAIQTQATLPPA